MGDQMTSEQPQSSEDLIKKYPGVTFIGKQCCIDTTQVKIEPGATIDLNGVSSIRGNSHIHTGAVVEGGNITHSKIFGQVSGGDVNCSTVEHGSHVSQGTVNHSQIHGFVSGGTVNHSTVNGSVSDGMVKNSTINGTVSGGTVNHSTVDGTVSGGVYNHTTVNEQGVSTETTTQSFTQRQGRYSSINGNLSVVFGRSVGAYNSNAAPQAPPYKPSIVNRNAKFDAEPPEDLVDPITFELIHNAVITRRGYTFDYDVIQQIIKSKHECPMTRTSLELSDLIPNRNLQRKIEDWKKQHEISEDIAVASK
jgi:hypothetical protein